MDRNSRYRLTKIDERFAILRKRREEKNEQHIRDLLFSAEHHAIAVAAMVLSGRPDPKEPLMHAWRRTLQRYDVKCASSGLEGQVQAAQQLRPIIMQGKELSSRITEIFAAAPVWLLQFTAVVLDAALLKFDLPDDISSELRWGTTGCQEARQYPKLPSGTLTAGDPVTDPERRIWLALCCMVPVKGDLVQALRNRFSEDEEEKIGSSGDALMDELLQIPPHAFEIEDSPDRKLPPSEKRRLRRISERISRWKKPSKRKPSRRR